MQQNPRTNIEQKLCSEYFQMKFSASEMNVILESRAGISMSRIFIRRKLLSNKDVCFTQRLFIIVHDEFLKS